MIHHFFSARPGSLPPLSTLALTLRWCAAAAAVFLCPPSARSQEPDPPPLPDAQPNRRVPLGLGTTALGLLTGAGTFAWARRRGGRTAVEPQRCGGSARLKDRTTRYGRNTDGDFNGQCNQTVPAT